MQSQRSDYPICISAYLLHTHSFLRRKCSLPWDLERMRKVTYQVDINCLRNKDGDEWKCSPFGDKVVIQSLRR